MADFGLPTIASDPKYFTTLTSNASCGTIRWMSPELLLDPDRFGPSPLPTKQSDCYALGMVILEVLSGEAPFKPYMDYVVLQKVLAGERPGGPQGKCVVVHR